ncbi:MAG TPA: hypothetical protein VF463_05135 [Sphingobium sp.]
MMGSRLVRTGVAMLLAFALPGPPVLSQKPQPQPLSQDDPAALNRLASQVLGRTVSESDVPASPSSSPALTPSGGTVPDVVEQIAPADGQGAEPPATASVETVPSAEAMPSDVAPAESLATPPQLTALPPLPAPDISVIEAQLLSVLSDAAGGSITTPATAMPYLVGRSCYLWSIKFTPVEGDLLLTEELRLPGPARNWARNWGGEGSATEVNPQGSAAVTQRHFDAAKGVAKAGWCVAKDDPVGSYRYILRQGDRELARFDFTVGDLL